jgi:formylglycine-generating enzyme required for sulfatase activity
MGISGAESMRKGTEDSDQHARPPHKVTIRRPFLLGRFPVTVGEYAVFATETNRTWAKPDFPQANRHPAVNVGFDDAVAYAEWLSERTADRYRLPSEAEWEYACRAGTSTAGYWGDESDPEKANVNGKGTTEVDGFPANPWGLYDMLGNVFEWVEDRWHKDYKGAPNDGSAWVTGGDADHVLRGGSWNINPKRNRAGNRDWSNNRPRPWAGFRLARTL